MEIMNTKQSLLNKYSKNPPKSSQSGMDFTQINLHCRKMITNRNMRNYDIYENSGYAPQYQSLSFNVFRYMEVEFSNNKILTWMI